MAEVLPPSSGRVKRQVSARQHRFATICPPGFEDLCLEEARALGLQVDASIVPGSIFEWNGRLEDLWRACLFSRIASRILVRLDSFHAGAREELFRKALAFPWELWLSPDRGIRIDAHIEYSRISHEGMAAETLQAAIRRRMIEAGLPLPPAKANSDLFEDEEQAGDGVDKNCDPDSFQRVLVRIVHNHTTISLDACGDHLHRRGWRLLSGSAPLRENLAAALLLAAGWPEQQTRLIDGMSGSGSFGIEALGMAAGLPAAARRDFAFCHWPSFSPQAFSWLQKQKTRELSPDISICSNELDPTILAQARANADLANLPFPLIWQQGDFFEFEAEGKPGLLVLNPPYGIRLSDSDGGLYPAIIKRLAASWQGWDVLLLGPNETNLAQLKTTIMWSRTFRHGGLRIAAWLLRL